MVAFAIITRRVKEILSLSELEKAQLKAVLMTTIEKMQCCRQMLFRAGCSRSQKKKAVASTEYMASTTAGF